MFYMPESHQSIFNVTVSVLLANYDDEGDFIGNEVVEVSCEVAGCIYDKIEFEVDQEDLNEQVKEILGSDQEFKILSYKILNN